MISIDYSLLLVILNFVVLILVLNKLLYKPIKKFLADRQNEIAKDIEDAKTSKQEALKLTKQKENELKKSTEELREMRQRSKKDAETVANNILENAKEGKKKILIEAEHQIENEKEKAVKTLKTELAGLIEKISEKVIYEKLDSEKDSKLIEEMLSQEVKSER